MIILAAAVISAVAISVVYLTARVTPPSTFTTISSRPSDNNSYENLLRFTERLIAPPVPSQSYPVLRNITLLPGELPRDISIGIPIPNNAEIIGSLERSYDEYKQVEILLDVPFKKPNETVEFYRNSLKKVGWNEHEAIGAPQAGGFISTTPYNVAIFCRYENKGPSLTINVYTPDIAKPEDVRLNLNTDPQASVCIGRPAAPIPFGGSGIYQVMPNLIAPAGAVQRTSGSGGSLETRYSEATIETELSTNDLETYYRNQLTEAGWKLKEKGNDSSFAWSTWSFADQSNNHWSGFLFVSDAEQKNLHHALFILQPAS